MNKETLSGKRVHYANYGWLYEEKDVKEFIKKLKAKFDTDRPYFAVEIQAMIDKLAGEELTK